MARPPKNASGGRRNVGTEPLSEATIGLLNTYVAQVGDTEAAGALRIAPVTLARAAAGWPLRPTVALALETGLAALGPLPTVPAEPKDGAAALSAADIARINALVARLDEKAAAAALKVGHVTLARAAAGWSLWPSSMVAITTMLPLAEAEAATAAAE